MSSKKKTKRQKVKSNKKATKEQKSKRNIWILLGYLFGALVKPVIGEIIIRLPKIASIIEALIGLLSQ